MFQGLEDGDEFSPNDRSPKTKKDDSKVTKANIIAKNDNDEYFEGG